MTFTPVILESPYAGNVERNVAYARACMRDCLLRGEAPFASHLLYTQPGVLDDDRPGERSRGIRADLGISGGMSAGIAEAERRGCAVEYRSLPGWGTGDVESVEHE